MLSKKYKKEKSSGFTIIEMMIAISLFLIIVIYGMQSLLNASFVHKKSQDMRSVLDSLSFILDDMSKNIRTGSIYHCITNLGDSEIAMLSKPESCENGIGISFELSNGDPSRYTDQWVYFIKDKAIYKTPGTESGTYDFYGDNNIQLTPTEVEVDSMSSGFSILGAKSEESGDRQQPLVTIRLSGKIKDTPFSVETAVSQRLIDVIQ